MRKHGRSEKFYSYPKKYGSTNIAVRVRILQTAHTIKKESILIEKGVLYAWPLYILTKIYKKYKIYLNILFISNE